MINDDQSSHIKIHTVLYADGTTFLSHSNDFNNVNILVENTINHASLWFKANEFQLNE